MAVSAACILLVDDDDATRRALKRSLERILPTFEFVEAASADEATACFQRLEPIVVVADLTLDEDEGPESGFRLVEELNHRPLAPRIIVLTGHGSDDMGIEALRRGAASFLVKPAHPEHLAALIADAVRYGELQRKFVRAQASASALPGIVTLNAKMQQAIDRAVFAAHNEQPVLLIGETGTGKGVFARAIHSLSGRRGRFVRAQPTFGNPDLAASELFGHQRGAFTGATENRAGILEEANLGTVFLDEVDELPLETQVMLLEALQERTFRRVGSTKPITSNFRLITATNCRIDEALRARKLREDFYHRIAHITIELPPLRERSEDIASLSQKFFDELVLREKLSLRGFSDAALAALERHPFPGNVRELQARVESAAHLADFHERNVIEVTDLDLPRGLSNSVSSKRSFREQVDQFELQLIRDALTRHDNNQSEAARSLQLDRTTLRRILARL